jgi:hypothetical protein
VADCLAAAYDSYTPRKLHNVCTQQPNVDNERMRVLKILKNLHPDKNKGCVPQAKHKFLVCSNAQSKEDLRQGEQDYPDMTFQDYFANTAKGKELLAAHGSAAQAAKDAADSRERVRQEAAEAARAAQQKTAAAEQAARAAEQAAAGAAAAARAAEARAAAAASADNEERAKQAAEANDRAQFAAREARRAAADARTQEAQARRELEILIQAQMELGMGTAENPFDLTGGRRARATQTVATRFSSSFKTLQ